MNKRRKFTSAFKTKVVLEALSERYSIQELAREHEVHANQISQWKNQFLAKAESVFEKPANAKSEEELEKERLYKVIGQQKIKID
jgi:transposase